MLEAFFSPVITIIVAYLIGSLSSAIVLCKLAGLPDPRSQGSGNPGATNVLRLGNTRLAVTVLIIDIVKGIITVAMASILGLGQTWLAAAAFFVFLGHLYPIFFGFKGGKGVATALGGFLVLSPMMAGIALLTWLIVFSLSRISSLSAIIAAAMIPVYSLWCLDNANSRWIVLVISIILLLRHSSNIQHLLAGEETKL